MLFNLFPSLLIITGQIVFNHLIIILIYQHIILIYYLCGFKMLKNTFETYTSLPQELNFNKITEGAKDHYFFQLPGLMIID